MKMLIATLLLGLAMTAVQAAVPDPANALFVDHGTQVPLVRGRIHLYDSGDGRMQAALAMCRHPRSGALTEPAAAPVIGCGAGQEGAFIDPQTRQVVGKGRGLSEFSGYRLLDRSPATQLAFLTPNGAEHVAVILSNDGGGSGSFLSLGVVSGREDGRQGSALVLLGDRIEPQSLTYNERSGLLSVTYLDRTNSDSRAAPPTKRVVRFFSLSGNRLVEKMSGRAR